MADMMVDADVGEANSAKVVKNLHTHGPALVSKFQVHRPEFRTSTDRTVYTGPATGDVKGSHAMVLVGHRVDDATGAHRFLIQNWWSRKPFVEVDAQYLASSSAMLTFVPTPQPRIPESFAVNDAAHVELEMDVAEQAEPEGP